MLILFVILLLPGISPSAQASSADTNTMSALVNGTSCTLQLTSYAQMGSYMPIFTQMGDNGYPLAAVTLYIPLDARAGSVYESGDGNNYFGAGVAYSDYATGAAYSTLTVSTTGDDYIGFAAGQTAWTLAIDDVSEDGSVICGSFDVFFESAFYGSGEPTSILDGVFCLDLAQLPASSSPSLGTTDSLGPFSDPTLDSLLGPIGIPDLSIPAAGSGESTPCTYCQGKGYTRICSNCNGLGYDSTKDVLYKGAYVCPSCLGKGNIICVICGGDGLVAP